jgi:hypothetical protein
MESAACRTGAAAGPGELAVNVATLGGTRRRIELQGRLPVGWAGWLASGLTSQRVNIVRGWARDGVEGRWHAELEVELPEYLGLTPAVVLQLTAPEAAPQRERLDGPELLSHRLVWSGGDLVVEIEAADARGFLDGTLRVFALFGLFPREMQIETADGLVHDVFRLRGVRGGTPESAPAEALRAKLERLTLP